MATGGWRGLETGDLGDQLEFGVLLAVFAQLFVELQCLQRNIWKFGIANFIPARCGGFDYLHYEGLLIEFEI